MQSDVCRWRSDLRRSYSGEAFVGGTIHFEGKLRCGRSHAVSALNPPIKR